ncbi:olfactory receptor 14A16-like [Mauremys mutica]|uniref:olfactory receptor 14A16-like n=1 Tax=Mauremys mutica TaxID=74926 RepID=UPI001D168EF7|nr:olfactory receptor 14A16-like [Mauremys mutica]
MGNLLIIMVVALDHHLHSPMYFFLMNLSILDLGTISVTVPKSMANSLMNTRTISYSGCVAQVFFVVFFAVSDFALLTIMAYDRYVAICKPLHYETIMNRRAFFQIAASALINVIVYSSLHTRNIFAISFCGGNELDQFFCEISQLLKLACSDTYLGEVEIFQTVLRIPTEQGRHKALSTCLPHLIVVSLFVSTGIFAYLKPTSSSPSGLDLMVAVLYSVLPPVMNPIIYSMRNKEIKASLRKLTGWRLFSKNKVSIFLL